MRGLLSSLLAFSLVIGPVPSAMAQEQASSAKSSVSRGDSDRITGTSFGSREIGGGIAPGGQSFQESGLTYQVHILGDVGRPGTYRVPASTRLSEALQQAGGVNSVGSERRVEIRRTEGGGGRFDLLSFKRFGNLDANPYLLDNDVIFVPLKGKVVQIAGTVKRAGTYELVNERTLEDLVRLASGFTPGIGNPVPLKVIRFNHGEKELIDVENTEEARRQFQLQNADVIVAPHFLTQGKRFDYNLANLPGDGPLFYPSYEERIFVLGAVTNPGPFPYNPYYNVREYLTLAGGTTKLAKSRKIKLVNSEGKTIRISTKTALNPGDTIIVPEKYMAPENLLSLVLGITTSVLGITATVVTLTR